MLGPISARSAKFQASPFFQRETLPSSALHSLPGSAFLPA